MTNKKMAAYCLLLYTQQLLDDLHKLSPARLACIVGKSRLNDHTADKIKVYPAQIAKPFIERLQNLVGAESDAPANTEEQSS